MLQGYAATKVEMIGFYRRRLMEACGAIDKSRVTPEGVW